MFCGGLRRPSLSTTLRPAGRSRPPTTLASTAAANGLPAARPVLSWLPQHDPHCRPLPGSGNPAAVRAGAARLHLHADDAAHRPQRPGAARERRLARRHRPDARAAHPAGAGRHHPDGLSHGTARRPRPPLGRQRVGRAAGLRRRALAPASAGAPAGPGQLGGHAVGAPRPGPALQPGVSRHGIRRRGGAHGERDQAAHFLPGVPEPRLVRARRGRRRTRLEGGLRRRHQQGRGPAGLGRRTRPGAARPGRPHRAAGARGPRQLHDGHRRGGPGPLRGEPVARAGDRARSQPGLPAGRPGQGGAGEDDSRTAPEHCRPAEAGAADRPPRVLHPPEVLDPRGLLRVRADGTRLWRQRPPRREAGGVRARQRRHLRLLPRHVPGAVAVARRTLPRLARGLAAQPGSRPRRRAGRLAPRPLDRHPVRARRDRARPARALAPAATGHAAAWRHRGRSRAHARGSRVAVRRLAGPARHPRPLHHHGPAPHPGVDLRGPARDLLHLRVHRPLRPALPRHDDGRPAAAVPRRSRRPSSCPTSCRSRCCSRRS